MVDAPKITEEQLATYFGQAGFDVGCPVCKTRSWSIIPSPSEDTGHTGIPLFSMDGSVSLPTPHIPLYMLVCNNCGYARSHAKIIVDNAIRGDKG